MQPSRSPQFAANGDGAARNGTPGSASGAVHDGGNGASGPTTRALPRGPGDLGPAWHWDYLRQRCLRETSRILRRREDAEEAAQEALLRAWRLRHRCRHPESSAAWVAQIARNEALRLRARRRLQPASTSLAAGEASQPQQAAPGESELLDRLSWQDALAHLPPADRALVVLCYAGDITQASLASALGMPEVSVRVRLHRIRNRLGQVIGPGQ
jgi:RNA polymerase sigma-70 factor (ECF subfamily)